MCVCVCVCVCVCACALVCVCLCLCVCMHEYKHIHILECTQFTFTLMVQVYHSVMTKYVPKRIHFSLEGMIARTQLAALDHNFNVGREHSTTESSEERFKVQYSRQKGDYVAKKIYEEKNYGYVGAMMAQVVDVAKGTLTVAAVPRRKHTAISRQVPPEKSEVVARLRSRLTKT